MKELSTKEQLMRFFRLRQLQGLIPMEWTFEQYVACMKQLYGVK